MAPKLQWDLNPPVAASESAEGLQLPGAAAPVAVAVESMPSCAAAYPQTSPLTVVAAPALAARSSKETKCHEYHAGRSQLCRLSALLPF